MSAIAKYFGEEILESWIFLVVGIIAVAASVYMITQTKTSYAYGFATALLAIAALQIGVGGGIIVRSPKDIARVQQFVDTDKSKITTEEIPRMQVVMRNFVVYRWVEIALSILGLLLFIICGPDSFWRGIGLGLLIQAPLMLLFDYFAEARGKVYLAYLMGL
jgi:hypothetical protein